MDLLALLLDPAPYMPHGMCLLWQPALIWTHLVSDILTGLSYFSIPVALLVFARKRRDLAYKWIFVMFGVFIFACGTTHFLGAWTLWHPDYLAQGMIKALTALVSVATAAALWPLLPKALAIPSRMQLEEANQALADQLQISARAESEVRDAYRKLEAASQALRESEARYAGIVNHAADAIFVVAVQPDGSFRYVQVNPALVRDTGIKADDLLGRTPAQALSANVAASVEANYRRAVEARQTITYEEVIEKPGGPQVWQTVLVPVLENGTGRVVQLVGTSRDLTQYRSLQEELAQSAKLATLGTMAAGIAHEMSQPLNAIRITAADCGLLLEEEGEPDLGYVKQGLDTIRDQAARMGGIIDQMRQFGRREPSRDEAFDPAEPSRRALGLLQRQFAAVGIAVEDRLPQDLPKVMGRAARLEQVMINLLANARDAVEEARRQGRTDSGLILLEGGIDHRRGVLTLSVEDDGIGLPPEVAERIFDPFFTTKEGEKGMGLGLSICVNILTTMGGRIDARQGARGARFTITLPLREDA
ncbi:MAG TPA: ATP-binding protein [Azospirillaceae bacterium]|nr:ATP-binding protein [Azospirillaceae bacterium]